MYLHGGGYCLGSATSHRALVAALSCEDMFHVFQFCVSLPEAQAAIERIGGFIRALDPKA